jgi:hypothetical protein
VQDKGTQVTEIGASLHFRRFRNSRYMEVRAGFLFCKRLENGWSSSDSNLSTAVPAVNGAARLKAT